jgi:ATP-dependent RNA/DNA helicase IGHMBP2
MVAMLAVQHRMNETLMRFPSDSKVDGRLEAAPDVAHQTLRELGVADDPLRPGALVFVDTAGRGWEDERTGEDPSTRNPGQAERASAELRRLLRRGLLPAQVAVITPYEAQARALRGLLAAERAAGIEIGTLDGFQGREKEAIVVDLVRSNDDRQIGFPADTRRKNAS